MNDLTALLTPALGASGIVVVVVLLILRGLLVPRSTLDMLRADTAEQLAAWKALAEGRQELIETQRAQLALLMGTAQTTERVLDAVSEAARTRQQEGGGGRALVQADGEG